MRCGPRCLDLPYLFRSSLRFSISGSVHPLSPFPFRHVLLTLPCFFFSPSTLTCASSLHPQPLYTRAELARHNKQGDGVGFKGHPLCTYCNARFYGSDELYAHLNESHEKCEICEQLGDRNVFLLNRRDLSDVRFYGVGEDGMHHTWSVNRPL